MREVANNWLAKIKEKIKGVENLNLLAFFAVRDGIFLQSSFR
jgi:hypothetical protein